MGKAVRKLDITMVIMGACSHFPSHSLVFGNQTFPLLRSAKVLTLLL